MFLPPYTHWLNDDKLIYNSYSQESNLYLAHIYSVQKESKIASFDYPVQASYKDEFYLSINYRRLLHMRPDYGYRCNSKINNEEIDELKTDGIWITDIQSAKTKMLHPLADILKTKPKDIFQKCKHNVNHLMIDPPGSGFIFIHRYYLGERRFDRLMYSNFKTLKVILDEEYVSHCHWITNEKIIGYVRAGNKNGYNILNINTGEVVNCETLNQLEYGDGHPSCYKQWVAFDSYPDKSRMQTLSLYNIKTNELIKLLEVYQSPKYKGETRCDLHPRFSSNGMFISFDAVFQGKRRHYYINVSKIIQNNT